MDTTELLGKIKGWHGIYDPTNEDAITNDECLEWIDIGRRYVCRTPRLRFSEFEDTMVTVASTRAYDLPAGWMSFTDLYYIDDDAQRKAIEWYSDKKRFNKRFPDPTLEGTVVGAVQWKNQLIFGLIPTEEVTIYRSGHKLPATLGLGETDDLLDELWENILWLALVTSGEYYTVPERKHGQWKQWAAEATEANRVLYKTAKTPPGRIVSHGPGTITPAFEEE